MTFPVLVIPLLLQAAIPLALLVWVAVWKPGNRVAWMLPVTASAAYIVAIGIAGLWLALPPHLPWIYAALLAALAAWKARRQLTLPLMPRATAGRVALALLAAAAMAAVGVAAFAFSGRRIPDGRVIELAFPLGPGTHVVLNGGSNALVNAHYRTLGDEARFRQYRGQSYGVDIATLNRWGLRATGLLPEDPAEYFAFGKPVLAPCTGTAVEVVDGIADLPPPTVDRAHMAGNHVIISCKGVWVVLGHLRNGSVRVATDAPVTTGQRLGDVGNSGNTAEPHLHVHAQTPGTVDAPLSGVPLHVRFDGEFFVRNQRVTR